MYNITLKITFFSIHIPWVVFNTCCQWSKSVLVVIKWATVIQKFLWIKNFLKMYKLYYDVYKLFLSFTYTRISTQSDIRDRQTHHENTMQCARALYVIPTRSCNFLVYKKQNYGSQKLFTLLLPNKINRHPVTRVHA